MVVGGELSDNKGINKQGGGLTAPALTAKDMEDIKTAMGLLGRLRGGELPQNATDMEMARQLCTVAAAGTGHRPGLIAKMERAEAIPRLEDILRVSDGIMVARGDLAVEVGNAAVPALQKKNDPHGAGDGQTGHHRHADDGKHDHQRPCPPAPRSATWPMPCSMAPMPSCSAPKRRRANTRWKPCAKWPTSAPPPRPPKTLAQTADFAARHLTRIDQSIALGALFTAHHLGAKAIVAMTDSGSTALWMSRHRIHIPIYALTPKGGHPAQDGAVPQREPAADGHQRRARHGPWSRPKTT